MLKDRLDAIRENPPVQPGDRVHRLMTKEELTGWLAYEEALISMARADYQAAKRRAIAKARMVLFWETVEASHERYETVEERGMMLGIRKDDKDRLLLVEMPIPKQTKFPPIPPWMLPGGGDDGEED